MGLLDKFNRGMSALETGLLGNATAYNPQLAPYLSQGTLDRANKDARMQLGLAMLAASESGMGFGQGMMMAQQAAQQSFQQPLQQDLQGNMTVEALEKIKAQREQEAQFGKFLSSLPEAERQQLSALPKSVAYQVMAEMMTRTQEGVTPSDDMKEYQFAAQQGYKGSLQEWIMDQKRAGATQVSVGLPPQESEFLKSLGKGRGEQFSQGYTGARSAASTLEQLNVLEPLVNSPGFISGPLGETRLQVAKVLGLQGAEETQAYFAAVGRQVGENIKMFGAGTGLSDADREFAKQMAAGSIELTPQAIKRIMRINRQVSEGVIRTYNEDRDFIGSKRPEIFDLYPAVQAPGSIKITRVE